MSQSATLPSPAGLRRYPLARRLAAPIEAGVHPATGQPILPGAACGTCTCWFDRGRAEGGVRFKCARATARRGGPNLPAETPACLLHSAKAEP